MAHYKCIIIIIIMLHFLFAFHLTNISHFYECAFEKVDRYETASVLVDMKLICTAVYTKTVGSAVNKQLPCIAGESLIAFKLGGMRSHHSGTSSYNRLINE